MFNRPAPPDQRQGDHVLTPPMRRLRYTRPDLACIPAAAAAAAPPRFLVRVGPQGCHARAHVRHGAKAVLLRQLLRLGSQDVPEVPKTKPSSGGKSSPQ